MASTLTPLIPGTSRLDRGFARVQEALSLARSTSDLAGPDADAFGHLSITVPTAERVDELAAAWGTRAEWRAGDSQYVAVTGDSCAELEAVWFRPAMPAQRGAAA